VVSCLCSISFGLFRQQVVSGILASVDGDKLVTGKSWKCTTVSVTGWFTKSFDDKSWPEAVIAGTNSATDIHKNLPQIHSSASWIWTSKNKDPTIDKTVYCRGYLGKHQQPLVEVTNAKILSYQRTQCVRTASAVGKCTF